MRLNASIDASLLLFVGLLLVTAAVYLVGMRNIKPDVSTKSVRMRLLLFAGLMVTASLIFLGGIWPSYFTLVALPVVPAPFLFGYLIFRPRLVSSWHKVRPYLAVCVILSAISWVSELFWLARTQ